MSASSEEINSALINISSISQNIVSETNHTSQSSQAQSVSIQDITNMSLQMQKLVDELEKSANQFKIKNLVYERPPNLGGLSILITHSDLLI